MENSGQERGEVCIDELIGERSRPSPFQRFPVHKDSGGAVRGPANPHCSVPFWLLGHRGVIPSGLECHDLFSCVLDEHADRGGVGDVAEVLCPGRTGGLRGCALLHL